MKKTKHFFKTIGFILFAAMLILCMVGCDKPASAEETYTATFMHKGEVVYKFTFTDTIEFPETPYEHDHGFKGWSNGLGKYAEGTTAYNFGRDVTFTSVWTEHSVRLICNNDLGLELLLPANKTYTAPHTAGSKRCSFAPVNYVLVGWKVTELDEYGTEVSTYDVKPGETITINSCITLSAIWELPSQK